jgi:hypothetical protein
MNPRGGDAAEPEGGRMTSLLVCLALQNDPEALLRRSVDSARAQKSFRVDFRARIEIPNSDPLDLRGTALAVADLLYIEYYASGGNVKFIVRRKDVVLEYHMILEEWVDAKEMADGSAGRGLSNPHGILDSLTANAKAARDAGTENGRRVVSLDLKGDDIRTLLKDVLDEKEVQWNKSSSQARIEIDPATGLLQKIASSAEIAWKDPKPIRYQGTVEIVSYEKEFEHVFQEKDRQGNVKRKIALDEHAKRKLGLLQK